nr:MAG TPA: transmembrane protein [Caudoviricetes sp.]
MKGLIMPLVGLAVALLCLTIIMIPWYIEP